MSGATTTGGHATEPSLIARLKIPLIVMGIATVLIIILMTIAAALFNPRTTYEANTLMGPSGGRESAAGKAPAANSLQAQIEADLKARGQMQQGMSYTHQPGAKPGVRGPCPVGVARGQTYVSGNDVHMCNN
jgi:hypothetical protein